MEGFYEAEADKKYHHLFQYRSPNCAPHFHRSCELMFLAEGSARVLIDGEMRVLEPGDACFVNGFQIHTYQPLQPAKAYIIVGAKVFFDDFFLACGKRSPVTFFQYDHFDFLKKLFDLYAGVEDGEIKRKAFSGAVDLVLSDLVRSVPFAEKGQTHQNVIICNLLQYVEENLTADLSLKSVASRFNYSEAYISRLVKKYMNEGWCAYVNSQRAEQARKILRDRPNQKIAEVAAECGFDSVKTFYRVYSKQFGAPPKRKNVKK